jgi:hypothetical protein
VEGVETRVNLVLLPSDDTQWQRFKHNWQAVVDYDTRWVYGLATAMHVVSARTGRRLTFPGASLAALGVGRLSTSSDVGGVHYNVNKYNPASIKPNTSPFVGKQKANARERGYPHKHNQTHTSTSASTSTSTSTSACTRALSLRR